MKTLFHFLFTIVLITFIACQKDKNIVNPASEKVQKDPLALMLDCNDNANGNCPSITYVETTLVVTVPKYPDCNFSVKIMIRNCPAGYDIKLIEYRSTNINPPGNICLDWDNDLTNAIIAGTDDEFFADFDKRLEIAIIIELGGPVYCNSATPIKSFGYATASCTRTIGYYEDGGGTAAKFRKVPCGTGCCRTTYTYCIDPITGIPDVRELGKTGSVGRSCVWTGPPIVYPLGTFYYGWCTPQCDDFN